jgi:AGZA family xanthine/uracil permease-like MFS transporter
MEKFFRLKEHGTTVKTEILAGITTFMTMAYILSINPSMLSLQGTGSEALGMDFGAVFTATALSAIIATLVMGLMLIYRLH